MNILRIFLTGRLVNIIIGIIIIVNSGWWYDRIEYELLQQWMKSAECVLCW